MTTQSGKAKGRRFQQQIVTLLYKALGYAGGLSSTSMGVKGTDIQDPYHLLPFTYIECRNREAWPNLNELRTEMQKAKPGWLFCIKKNRTAPLFVMDETAFQKVMAGYFSTHTSEG